ncbi:MAG: hypothetical protein JWQ23_3752 [Herminiimonas sp.]|nr:hypothetical protein [Herminiimonas sp.]
MSPDIVIIRESDGFRLLHGHLHLAIALDMHDEVKIDVKGEGEIQVLKTRQGFFVSKDNQRLPLFVN